MIQVPILSAIARRISFSYRKSYFKFLQSPIQLSSEELIKASSKIPNDKFSFASSLTTSTSQTEQQQMLLSQLKQDYLQDSTNPNIIFQYMNKLNEQQLYEESLTIYNSIGSKNQSGSIQQEYLKALINKKSHQYQNYSSQILFSGALQFLLIAGILYQLQIYHEYTQKTQKIDQITKDDQSVPNDRINQMDRVYNIFRNNQPIQEEKNIPTRFFDVLGIDEYKEELEEIVEFLKNPKKYTDSGAKLPRGILLIGAPGTGKTLLARALAGEAGCSFFYKSGSEFDEMFVGVGASRVREIFKTARSKAPSIIFIDEIDSIGGKRRVQDPSSSRDTINQILTEMDGFKQSENVIVIGATNFESVLDPALKRPGRFDKSIHIPLPDVKGREKIFLYFLEKIKYDADQVKPSYLARQSVGLSGADISNMVNVAILNAVKHDREMANAEDFEFAIDRIAMGISRKNMLVSDKDKLLTAYHECGHALTSLLTKGAIPLHKVTILPRGNALGFTSMLPESDQLSQTKNGMMASIDVAMGGRAAEDLIMGQDEITSGCSNDLSKATELAYMYVKQGMDDKISLVTIQAQSIKTSDQFDYMMDMEVKKILQESYSRVKLLLKVNERKLEKLAKELLKRETMSANDIKTLLSINY